MNIHSIHFEEGIKPRLRSARQTRSEQEPKQPYESFQSATEKSQSQVDQARLRELARRLPAAG